MHPLEKIFGFASELNFKLAVVLSHTITNMSAMRRIHKVLDMVDQRRMDLLCCNRSRVGSSIGQLNICVPQKKKISANLNRVKRVTLQFLNRFLQTTGEISICQKINKTFINISKMFYEHRKNAPYQKYVCKSLLWISYSVLPRPNAPCVLSQSLK